MARPAPGATRRHIGLTAIVLVAATLLLPGRSDVEPLAWAVVASGAVLSLGAVTDIGQELWRREVPVDVALVVGAASLP